MTIKYHVVGAMTSDGTELKYNFNSKDVAFRYARFYSGNTKFPREPEHVGSVCIKADTAEELLTALTESGETFRPVVAQRVGQVTRQPKISIDVSKLLEGLNLSSVDELTKFITGNGDSSGIRIEPFQVSFDDLEARALSRMLNEDAAERISLEEMFKRYGRSGYGLLADKLNSLLVDTAVEFSSETPEVKCGCMLCAINDLTEQERVTNFATAATATEANGQQHTAEDPHYAAEAETPAPVESATVGIDPIIPVKGKSYYVKLSDFEQAQLIKAKVLHASDNVVELEFMCRNEFYIAAYPLSTKCVKFLEEVKQ